MPQKAILIFILLIATYFRFTNLDNYGLCGDEKNSFFGSQFVAIEGSNQADVFYKKNTPYFTPQEFWKPKSTADFYDAIARCDNGSSALHAYLLHHWMNIFGNDDGAARALSALFGVLFVLLVYFFVNYHFQNKTLALMVAGLVAVEPMFVGWSHIVRTYTTSFFFCLLATHLFLVLLKKQTLWLYLAYGLCAFTCLMCHYANFTLFVIHGLLVLLFVRQWRQFLGLGLAMCIPALGMLWWIAMAGGQYAIKFMADSAHVYTQMAREAPVEGFLALTNPKSILVQIVPIVGNHFIVTNSLSDVLLGNKNVAISVFVAIFSIVLYVSKLKPLLKYPLIYAIFGVAFLVYTKSAVQFTVFSSALLLLAIFIKGFWQEKEQKPLIISLLLLAILPLIFLTVIAYQDGNTFRIQQKYAGYGLVYASILIGLGLKYAWREDALLKYPLYAVLMVQLFFVVKTNVGILNDNAPRFLFNSQPRMENPHRLVARKIVEICTPADTILYPSFMGGEDFKYGIALPSYSIKDAQLVNFYLPKNATYWQRMNPAEHNKIFIKKSDNQLIELFDFEGGKFRY